MHIKYMHDPLSSLNVLCFNKLLHLFGGIITKGKFFVYTVMHKFIIVHLSCCILYSAFSSVSCGKIKPYYVSGKSASLTGTEPLISKKKGGSKMGQKSAHGAKMHIPPIVIYLYTLCHHLFFARFQSSPIFRIFHQNEHEKMSKVYTTTPNAILMREDLVNGLQRWLPWQMLLQDGKVCNRGGCAGSVLPVLCWVCTL